MDTHKLENLFDALFPITRSISGNGLRESLSILGTQIPINIIEYPSGSEHFDWTIPNEWNIKDAYIKSLNGEKVIDLNANNLHILGYSIPFKGRITISELKKHLHYIQDKPNAIPFVTSYYKPRWGFCLSYNKFLELNEEEYDVLVDSTIEPGSISVGECVIKGTSDKEILLLSHIGHPSMANDQLSGPLTIISIAKWLVKNHSSLKYSYRIILAPETIGSIAYISANLLHLRNNCIGGYSIVCTGDKNSHTYNTSKAGNSISDKAMKKALLNCGAEYNIKKFTPLGCDERHFNSHGIGIPIGSIMRSSPGSYPEYHTSLDNKKFISFENIMQTSELVINAIRNIETYTGNQDKNQRSESKSSIDENNHTSNNNQEYDAIVTAIHLNCEPKLDKYDLYPTLSDKNSNNKEAQNLISLWAYSDGSTLSEIAKIMNISIYELRILAEKLAKHNIIRIEVI